jgi:hypothetical protein
VRLCSHGFKWLRLAVPVLIGLVLATAARGAVGDDGEKPVPTFTRAGDRIVAELIPRAKSTAVRIAFAAAGGRLSEVRGLDFAEAARPSVNARNFRSALFATRVEAVPVGGEVRVSIASAFFTRATRYFVFNEHLPEPWMDAGAENRSLPQRVQELVVTVRDGGPLDADGASNGHITLIGGPRDSFWGYAVGTLFIRFFGIFIVLSTLMLGMIVSGMVFKRVDAARRRAAPAGTNGRIVGPGRPSATNARSAGAI